MPFHAAPSNSNPPPVGPSKDVRPAPRRRLGAAMLAAGLAAGLGLLGGLEPAAAGEVEIREVAVTRTAPGVYRFDVTLRHGDTGWDHYANKWEVLGPDGTVLGERVLLHPHEHEQPFTRSLSGVRIPESVDQVRIRAHDTQHGASPRLVTVDVPR